MKNHYGWQKVPPFSQSLPFKEWEARPACARFWINSLNMHLPSFCEKCFESEVEKNIHGDIRRKKSRKVYSRFELKLRNSSVQLIDNSVFYVINLYLLCRWSKLLKMRKNPRDVTETCSGTWIRFDGLYLKPKLNQIQRARNVLSTGKNLHIFLSMGTLKWLLE